MLWKIRLENSYNSYMLKDSGKRLEGSNNMKLSTVVIGEKSINPGGKPRFSRTREVDTGTIDESELKSSNEPTTDAKFCEKLLQDGFVQSLDFYHLTHRLDPNPSDNRGIEKIQIPVADMRYVRDCLMSAELCRRHNERCIQSCTTSSYSWSAWGLQYARFGFTIFSGKASERWRWR